MKILVIAEIDFDKPYGCHTRPFFISKYLKSLGHDVLALGIRNQKRSIYPWIKELRSMRLFWPLRYLSLIKEVISYLITFKPNVIYVHSNIFSIIAKISKKLCLQKNCVLILDKHGSWAVEQVGSSMLPISVFVEGIALKHADKIIAASECLKQDLCRIYKSESKKVFAVPNGVDVTYFKCGIKKDELSNESEKPKKKIIVFSAPRNFVSNIIGIKFIYEAMAKFSNDDAVLLITGGGPIIEPKPTNVIYTGFVENLPDYLNSADIAVLPYPSSAKCGGARNKILEYFACSVPVVSTKEGIHGVNDALVNVHYILASDSPIDFADKIAYALNLSSEQRQNLTSSAYDLVKNRYTWESSALMVNRLMESFLIQA